MSQAADERRFRAYRISKFALRAIFNSRVKLEGVTLPTDARVEAVHLDVLRDAILVLVSSMEFEPSPVEREVPDGTEALLLLQYPETEAE